jgi:hypothetical protein
LSPGGGGGVRIRAEQGGGTVEVIGASDALALGRGEGGEAVPHGLYHGLGVVSEEHRVRIPPGLELEIPARREWGERRETETEERG